jgi:cob(I)alamin adenosyltransferase
MAKSALYTRTGDRGTTSLVGGERVKKTSTRLEAYGTVDEFSSLLGVILSSPDCPDDQRNLLIKIQNKLFNIGGYLATNSTDDAPATLYGLTLDDITEIEQHIDHLDDATPKIRAFVLPGGAPLSAHTHVARSVCRRAERCILRLAEEAPVDTRVTEYFNRLSDYLFILARYINHHSGINEIIWNKDA